MLPVTISILISYEHAYGALLSLGLDLDLDVDADFREVDVATIKDSRLLPPTHF